jgi:hypothetical protein
VSLTQTVNADGTVTERGSARNAGTSTARSVMADRTWYGKRGEILDHRYATVAPSTLGPGKTGTFTIVRPALADVQRTRTQLRAT